LNSNFFSKYFERFSKCFKIIPQFFISRLYFQRIKMNHRWNCMIVMLHFSTTMISDHTVILLNRQFTEIVPIFATFFIFQHNCKLETIFDHENFILRGIFNFQNLIFFLNFDISKSNKHSLLEADGFFSKTSF
jgi:hypothetical protein